MPLPQAPEYIQNLVPYVPGKPIEETQREFGLKKVVKLASNENPLGSSPRGRKAAALALKEGHRYPDGSAFGLKTALARQFGVETSELVVGNGSEEILSFLIRAYCLPGDAVVASEGAFIAYRINAQMQGVTTISPRLGPGMKFDLPAMARSARENPKVKIVFLPNPNNPTGTYHDENAVRAFLREIAQISRADGSSVLVVLDYAYWEYVTAKDLPDPIALWRDFENVIVLRTFSKVYGMGGYRLGYAVARSSLIRDLEKLRAPFNVNSLALAAGEAALADRAFVRKAVAINTRGMRFWKKELAAIKLPYIESQGNFILTDVRKWVGRSGVEVQQECLKLGLILRPVANYGLPDHLRISIGLPSENVFAARVLRKVQAGFAPEKPRGRGK